jgi:hypothetical protein
MKNLSPRGTKWLKAIHVTLACAWVGAGVSLVIMQFALTATGGQELYGIDRAKKFIDDFIIIPGAFGMLITGLIYSLFTPWGFFKHNWVTVKWVINVGGILFGTFFLGPWINGMPPISGDIGLKALTDAVYMHNKGMNSIYGTMQVATLIFAVVISVLKPWKKKKV